VGKKRGHGGIKFITGLTNEELMRNLSVGKLIFLRGRKNMEAKKKLSIGDLIANVDKIKSKKSEIRELYVKSLDATVIITKPTRSIILDSNDLGNEGANLFLVYECVTEPSFKNTTLQDAYGATGYEVLEQILEPGEVDNIAKEIIKFGGYTADNISIVDSIKN